MRAAIDKAGRVVIPKPLRDELGLRPGDVEVTSDGAALRIEPITSDHIVEEDGRLVIPPAGAVVDDHLVRDLRFADQQ
jgi:AbrB family looped-hinge helix DNA binding protein